MSFNSTGSDFVILFYAKIFDLCCYCVPCYTESLPDTSVFDRYDMLANYFFLSVLYSSSQLTCWWMENVNEYNVTSSWSDGNNMKIGVSAWIYENGKWWNAICVIGKCTVSFTFRLSEYQTMFTKKFSIELVVNVDLFICFLIEIDFCNLDFKVNDSILLFCFLAT